MNSTIQTKSAFTVTSTDELWVDSGLVSPWVNRGADKLAHALTTWSLPVAGRRCLDIGASTGGFTQVLLAQGAGHVVALDVGHGQLHPEVAGDERVTNREGTSIRDVGPDDLGAPFDVIVADVSFISLRLVVAPIARLLAEQGWCVLLVKPQFEVGRERLGKNGVVVRASHRADALTAVVAAADGVGLTAYGLIESPLTGTHGNREYLLWVQSDPSGKMGEEVWRDRIETLTADRPREREALTTSTIEY